MAHTGRSCPLGETQLPGNNNYHRGARSRLGLSLVLLIPSAAVGRQLESAPQARLTPGWGSAPCWS